MKKVFFIGIVVLFCSQANAQDRFFVNPKVGIVWNSYSNSNENIMGNENVANVFWDNDWIFELLAGYQFGNRMIIESGLIYHNAVNRYYFDYSELNCSGGSLVSLGEGFLCIPLNVKYSIETSLKNLVIVPYLGVSYSTHKINASPYMNIYEEVYSEWSVPPDLIPLDTTAVVSAYRPTKNNVVLNYGVGVEYKVLKNLVFTLSGNFTNGFRIHNRIDAEVILEDRVESGSIAYRGNKFYLSAGIKIPL